MLHTLLDAHFILVFIALVFATEQAILRCLAKSYISGVAYGIGAILALLYVVATLFHL